MAWTAEQAKAQEPSNVVAFANDVKLGSLLLACCSIEQSPPATPTDSRTNIWTLIRYVNAAQEVAWWYAISKDAGACSITFDGAGDTFKGYLIAEFSTDQGTISFDTGAEAGSDKTVGGAGTDALVTDSITVSQDNSLVVSFVGSDTGGVSDLAAGTGCVLDAQGVLSNAGGDRVALEHQAGVAAGAKTLPWTLTSAYSGPVLVAAFKAAGSVSGISNRFQIRRSRGTSW